MTLLTEKNSQILNDFQSMIFNIIIVIIYFLIFITALGFTDAEKYLIVINNIIKDYVCLFLIYRFNPLHPIVKFTNLDRRIAFSAGIFILTTSVLDNYIKELKYYKNKYFNHL